MSPAAAASPIRVLGRYALYERFAQGGMATVHFARLLGPTGFSRTVAIKQLHGHLAEDPEFVSMLIDEAHLAARVRHPNVVQTLDVIAVLGELFVVLDYVHGESLSRLMRAAKDAGERIDPPIVAAILFDVLQGLQAAHDAKDAAGMPLDIVHRDVSPQNILVGIDGVARVIDFGVAKARGRMHTTREGQLKGKLAYMAPEQIRGQVSQRSDVFSAAVVLWEGLTGRRLFAADDEGAIVGKLLVETIEPPMKYAPDLSRELSDVVMRGLARDPAERFASAREMAIALENSVALATPIDVGTWVEHFARAMLAERAERIAVMEAGTRDLAPSYADAPASHARATSAPPSAPTTRDAVTTSSATLALSGLARPPSREAIETSAPRVSVASVAARRRVWPLAALGALAVIVLATLATSLAWRSPGEAPTPDLARSALPPPAPLAAPEASPSTASSVASSPSPASVTAASDARPRKTLPAVTASAARARTLPASCSPPYVTDSMGMRHYKAECLK